MIEQILKLLDSISVGNVATSGTLIILIRIAEGLIKTGWVKLRPILANFLLSLSVRLGKRISDDD